MQGKTVEVGRAQFETETTRFTILDAPVSYLFVPFGSLNYSGLVNYASLEHHSRFILNCYVF